MVVTTTMAVSIGIQLFISVGLGGDKANTNHFPEFFFSKYVRPFEIFKSNHKIRETIKLEKLPKKLIVSTQNTHL